MPIATCIKWDALLKRADSGLRVCSHGHYAQRRARKPGRRVVASVDQRRLNGVCVVGLSRAEPPPCFRWAVLRKREFARWPARWPASYDVVLVPDSYRAFWKSIVCELETRVEGGDIVKARRLLWISFYHNQTQGLVAWAPVFQQKCETNNDYGRWDDLAESFKVHAILIG